MFDDNNVDLSSLSTPPSDAESAGSISVPLASITTTVIEAAGSTSLVQVDNTYSFYPAGGSSGPQLIVRGAVFTEGQFGAWKPIGVEHTADGGYQVAWKFGTADQYTVWFTDSSGNYVSDIGAVSGSSYKLTSREASFGQDLNGVDGIGSPTTVIEAAGSTSLAHVADTYFFYPSGGSSGPQLNARGAAFTDGMFGAWTPFGVEHTADGGYQVALKFGAANQYTVWFTDANGTYHGDIGVVSGGSYKLTSREASFGQDLNGVDGIGSPTTVIEAAGSTSLAHVADTYFFYPSGGSSGPQLNARGAAFADGLFGAWTPIGVEHTADGGYQVAFKFGAADQYTVWFTDANGTYHGDIGAVSGGSYKLTSREASFGQDLNGVDGIGSPTTVIEAAGSTSLAHVADTYFFYPSGGSSGPQLNVWGTPFTDGMFGAWTPLGVEHTADGGYQVAFKFGAADQYTVWFTDANGTYHGDIGVVSGGSYKLTSREAAFAQDLNGVDGIGSPMTVIEAAGSTSLAHVADTYFFYPSGGSSGPQLNARGAAFTDGMFGAWTPFGVEHTADGGYQVALKFGAANQYTVWFTDANGTYHGDIGAVSGDSYKLTSREAAFAQDLNGVDGIGSPTTVVEAAGSTSLVHVADTYFFYPSGGSSGPQLNARGAPFTEGMFGAWTPIGVEHTADGGYQVAWKFGVADQYTVWFTDANGTYRGDIGAVSGGSYKLTSREAAFGQNLNGDGLIGSPTSVIETFGSIQLTQVADTYFLYAAGTSNGPQLNVNGEGVTVGQFGGWTPIAAEQQTYGYRVAWKLGLDQYTVWTTNINGSYVGDIGAVSGASTALRSFEPAFSQDLNGDGVTASAVPVESFGATRLTQVLDTYFLNSMTTGLWGAQLNLGNVAATPSLSGGWTPIAGEASGANYLVALKLGSDQYSVWTVNSWGSYISGMGVMSGSSPTLQSLEPSFAQDLNGDGTIGITRFNITIRYSGNSAYQSYFDAAARRWEQVITADLPDVNDATYGFIDDLLIDASVVPIDGRNNILGRAGPNAFRSGSGLPTHGIMQFDSADIDSMVSQGTFGDVVLHEMGHVLGLGTLWDAKGLKSTFTTYVGAAGVEAYRQLSGNGGVGTVPLETTGGSGTAGVHWSEAVFGNELMTGYIAGRPNPLSILTIGGLRDLGYTVNYGAADPYTMPGHLESASVSGGVDLSGLIAANADPASAWYGLVDGLETSYALSLVLQDEEDEEGVFALT